jgi:hypothetical protein
MKQNPVVEEVYTSSADSGVGVDKLGTSTSAGAEKGRGEIGDIGQPRPEADDCGM